MKVGINTVVTLHYKLSNLNSGEQIEQTTPEQPLEFLYGVERILPLFEESVFGLGAGENFSIDIPVDQAYGESDPNHVAEIPNEIFHGEDGKIDSEFIFVGAHVPMSDNEGNRMMGKVLEMTPVYVKMDFNHPLAGVALHFEGTIELVREASAEEISHGHSHGAHGQHH
ncbi:MAG: peptidylprolyl isomerase [Fluviicola sp.]|jgi:FKBP-type peptidyl-prolyl cis-trans isomerase SlyD